MEQGELDDVRVAKEQAEIKTLSDELDRRCKQVAHGVRIERLATLNDVTFQAIYKMLNTNNGGTEFGKNYIPSIAKESPDAFAETVLFFLCDLCGREHPDKKHDLSEKERLEGLRRELEGMDLSSHQRLKRYL